MRRAMRDEQKQERHQAILDIGWELFQTTPYDEVNMQEVATQAGLAKGTIYLYFKTKEALFLSILSQRFTEWFDMVDSLLPTTNSIEEVTAVLSNTLTSRPALTRLFAILHVILEKNIPYETAVAFKQMLQERLLHTGELIESRLPFLPTGQGPQFLLRAYAIVIGLQHVCYPTPIIQQVIDDHAMAIFRLHFAQEFSHSIQAMLYGWRQSQE